MLNTKSAQNKRKNTRTCRIEELENREMLSATPWTLANDYDVSRFACETESYETTPPERFASETANTLAPLGEAPDGYNAHDFLKLVAAGLIDENGNDLEGALIRWDQAVTENKRLVRLEVIDLNFAGNDGTLDLSGCEGLVYLDVTDNQLTELIVAGCEALLELHCEYNLLTDLDVSELVKLEVLHCHGNQLTELFVSNNTALIELDFSMNRLTTVNVLGLTHLEVLGCFSNQLVELNVTGLTKLKQLFCGGNALTFATLPVLNIEQYVYAHVWDLERERWVYAGQAEVSITLSAANTVDLRAIGATGYTWYRKEGNNNVKLVLNEDYTVDNGVFTFTRLKVGDVIHCEMTNEEYPYLTLKTGNATCVIPTAPFDVTVADKAGTSVTVTLTWKSGTLNWGDGYEIQYSSDGGKTWKFWTDGSTTVRKAGESQDITNLSAGNYQFRVRAVKVESGKVVAASDWSVTATKNLTAQPDTPATKPKKVTVGKKEEKPTISTITLNVNKGNSDAVSYIVTGTYKVSKKSPLWTSANRGVIPMDFSYTVVGDQIVIMGLQAGTKYTFSVRAVNASGKMSDAAATVRATTAKYTAEKVNAVPKSAGLTSIQFRTTPPKRPADTSAFNTFETKIVVSYKVKVNRVTTTYEATLMEGELVEVRTDGKKDDAITGHPFANLSASVNSAGITTLNGLPAAGTKYSVAVSTVASGLYGTVESASGKRTISTAKFPAPKKVAVKDYISTTGAGTLTWRAYTVPGNAPITAVNVYRDKACTDLIRVLVVGTPGTEQGRITLTGNTGGTFTGASGLSGTLYIKLVAEGVESRAAKVRI